MGYPFLIITIVAIAAFALGGTIMYVATNDQAAETTPAVEEKAVVEENSGGEENVTEEIVGEGVETEPEPEPIEKTVQTPPPPPPPQPAAIITVIDDPKPKTITLPGGAVAEVDAQGNIIRYISGDPNAAPPPPPPLPTPPPEPEFKYPWCKKKVADIVPNPGNYVIEMPSGVIAEFGREGLLFKYHCHPDGIIKP